MPYAFLWKQWTGKIAFAWWRQFVRHAKEAVETIRWNLHESFSRFFFVVLDFKRPSNLVDAKRCRMNMKDLFIMLEFSWGKCNEFKCHDIRSHIVIVIVLILNEKSRDIISKHIKIRAWHRNASALSKWRTMTPSVLFTHKNGSYTKLHRRESHKAKSKHFEENNGEF